MTVPASAPRDPGRQPERTHLAWHRTVLATTVVALLVGRLALVGALTPARLAVAGAAAAGWLLITVVSARRVAAMRHPAPLPPRWSVRATTMITLGYALLGVALVALR